MTIPTTDDLIAFLTARLSEEAADARFVHIIDCSHAFVSPEHCPCDCGIPARVGREVEADRALIAEYGRVLAKAPGNTPLINTLIRLMQARAFVHSDHPDYRQEWTPAANREPEL